MAPLAALHLCSGYGGFELALRSVARVRTVCHVERDPYAAAILVGKDGPGAPGSGTYLG
jgi:site-specific DNA-cytosine methylase